MVASTLLTLVAVQPEDFIQKIRNGKSCAVKWIQRMACIFWEGHCGSCGLVHQVFQEIHYRKSFHAELVALYMTAALPVMLLTFTSCRKDGVRKLCHRDQIR